MKIDFPVNTNRFWAQYLLTLALLFLLFFITYLNYEEFRDVLTSAKPIDPWSNLEYLLWPIPVAVQLGFAYISARKLAFSKFAVRMTNEGIFLDRALRAQFYPWENFSSATIEIETDDGSNYFRRGHEWDPEVTFHYKDRKSAMTYQIFEAQTTISEFKRALEHYIPVEVSDEVQELMDKGR